MASSKHGITRWIRLGRATKEASYINVEVAKLRRYLEDRVAEKFAAISTTKGAAINTICTHQGALLLAARWLRENETTLTLAERLRLLGFVTTQTQARDRALARLDLDAEERSGFDSVFDVTPEVMESSNGRKNDTGDRDESGGVPSAAQD